MSYSAKRRSLKKLSDWGKSRIERSYLDRDFRPFIVIEKRFGFRFYEADEAIGHRVN